MTASESASIARLGVIADSGNYERLVETGREHLADFPESLDAHDFCAVGWIELQNAKKATPHIQFLLKNQPDATRTHFLTANWYELAGKRKKALKHATITLEREPDNAWHHFLNARVTAGLGKLRRARASLENALRLDPGNPDFINFRAQIDSILNESSAASLRVLETLNENLAAEPENPDTHAIIARLYLEKLEQPTEAEISARTALAIAPNHRGAKRILLQSIERRSFVFRVLSLPRSATRHLLNLLRACVKQPWRLFFFAVAFKLVAVFLLWLLVAHVVFSIPAKFYEWFVLAEIKAMHHNRPGWKLWHSIRRQPVWLRCGIAALTTACFWLGLLSLLEISLEGGVKFLLGFAAANALAVGIWVLARKGSVRIAQKRKRNSTTLSQ